MADNQQTTVEVLVNGKQAEAELDKVRKQVDDLRSAWISAAQAGDKAVAESLRKELKKSERELKTMESGVQAVERTFRQLDKATPTDLQRSLKFLQSGLKNIERGSSAWTEQVNKIRLLKAELDKVNAEMRSSESVLTRIKNGINNWGASIVAGAAGISGLVAAGRSAVKAYADMQQEEANVRKYTGMTEEQVARLNEEFKRMDTRTSREALNMLAQEAGRLGKQSEEDVLGFVRAADKINVALDDLGDGATLTLSKLTTIFGDEQRLGTEKALLSVGSVINELSQNCTASAPYLAEFAQRLAGVGAQAGMSIPEIMGFGAVLDAQGQNVEMSATALSKVIMSLFKNPEKIAKATGLSIQEFSDTCKRSANEGLMLLLRRLNELGGIDALAPVFADMGENGARASAVLAALAGNVDTVRRQQEAANIAFREAVSIDKEFDVQNTTVQAGLEKARKNFNEMAVTLGHELLPAMQHVISGTSATMKVMLKVIQFVKEYREAVIGTTATLVAYYAIVNAQNAWNTFVSGAKKAVAAVKAFNTALLSNPYAAVAAAIVGIGTALALVIKRRSEATLQEKVLADAEREISGQYTEQKSRIDMLNDALHDESLSLAARRKALQELQAIVPGYHGALTEEGKLINDNADAIEAYTSRLEKQIQLQVYQERLMELYRQKMTAEENVAKGETSLAEARAEAQAHSGEIQIHTSGGAAGPAGGYKNSYMVNVQDRSAYLDSAKKQLGDISEAIDAIRQKMKEGDLLEPPAASGSADLSANTAAAPGNDNTDDTLKQRLKAIEEAKKKELALNQIAYLQGEKDFRQYTGGQLQIEADYQRQKMALYESGSTEYLQAQAALLEAQKKQQDAAAGLSVEAEQQRHALLKAAIDQHYADNKMSARAYQYAMEEIELMHLHNLIGMYKEGSEERIKAQENYNRRSLQIQTKHAQDAQKIQENLRNAYFSAAAGNTDPEGMEEEKAQLEIVRQQLLAAAASDEQRLRIEEAYQNARYEIARKYNDQIEMETVDAARAATDKIVSYLQSDAFQAFQQSFSTLVGSMGEIFSGLSDLMDAEVDLQTAHIEKRYDAEIQAAGKNAKQVARLEEEKEAEIAAIKTEAEEKKYNMQIISAVAQTAISALNAYSSAAAIPLVGPTIIAPIAAAAAVAAGGIQIATLKKQHEAAMAQGYAAGGYTMPGRKYEPAGIVHAGEWVASQELLANPTAAAAIAQLDLAQRTNTIGSIGKPDSTYEAIPAASYRVTTQNTRTEKPDGEHIGDTLERLNKRLDEPLYAATTITGDKGILRQQRRYEQMIRNKS